MASGATIATTAHANTSNSGIHARSHRLFDGVRQAGAARARQATRSNGAGDG
jgi:hypothetical protein